MAQLPMDADQEDIVLVSEVICGKCNVEMRELSQNKFECPMCKYMYVD